MQGKQPAERLDGRVTDGDPARMLATAEMRAHTMMQVEHFEGVTDPGYSSG